MSRNFRRIVALPLALTMVFLTAVSAAAFPPEFGISQSYRNFGFNGETSAYNPYEDVSRSIYWSPLSVKRLRVVVPWDIAERKASDPRRAEFQHWLDRTNELGADPFVVFGPTERTTSTDEVHSPAHYAPLSTYDVASQHFLAPSGSIYKIAIQDFLATWGPKTSYGVEEIGAWNEPNRGPFTMAIPPQLTGQVYLPGNTYAMNDISHCPSGATTSNCGPLLAAWYWEHAVEAMIEVCGFGNGNACKIAAGEFASSAGTDQGSAWPYWNTYANKITSIGPFTPEIISFHAHRDAEELGANITEGGANHDCKVGQTKWCVTTTFRQWMDAFGWSGLMQVWNTETGAAYKQGQAKSGVDAAQNNRFNWLIQISDEANVKRLYYFNFQGSGTDRGLIDGEPAGVDTRKRPIWDTVRCRQTPNSCPGWSPPPAPTVQTSAASGVQTTQATINGTVNPNGANTSYRFEYGPADCASNPCTKTPAADAYVGNGTSGVPESAVISGLQPGTTYHYRIVASNVIGASQGANGTFTTLRYSTPAVLNNTPSTGMRELYYVAADGQIKQWLFTGKTWFNGGLGLAGKPPTPGFPASPGSSPVAIRNAPYEEVYYTGEDRQIKQWFFNGENWYNGELGAAGVKAAAGASPVVLNNSPAPGMRELYYVAETGQIREWLFDGKEWHNGGLGLAGQPPTLGAPASPGSSPVVIRNAPYEQVFYTGSDGQIKQWFFNGTNWYNEGLGVGAKAAAGSDPFVLNNTPGAGQLEIYYTGEDGQIKRWIFSGGKWSNSGLGSLGAYASPASSPVVLVPAVGMREIYYTGNDGHIQQWFFNGEKWFNGGLMFAGPPPTLGAPGSLGSSPSAIRNAPYEQVFYTGKDGQMKQWFFSGTSWFNEGL